MSRSEKGFTLIEVLISFVLLALISLGVYQALNGTYRLRFKLNEEGEFYNGIRMAAEIIQRDVALLYSPSIMIPKKEETNSASNQQNQNQNQSQNQASSSGQAQISPVVAERLGQLPKSDFWAEALEHTGIRAMRFYGDAESMSFVSASNIRVYRESEESDLVKVSFEMRTDTFPDALPDTRILVKEVDTNVFGPDTEDEKKKTYYLLHGVKKIKFRYWDSQTERWVPKWDSASEDRLNRYPNMIEMKIEVQTGERLNFEGIYKFKPEIPVNNGLQRTI